jgi:hypothetical protein
VGLERCPLSLVRIIEELLEWKSSCSGQENRINGQGDPLRWPRDTLYPQKLALTSPTSGGRSLCIVPLRTRFDFDDDQFDSVISFMPLRTFLFNLISKLNALRVFILHIFYSVWRASNGEVRPDRPSLGLYVYFSFLTSWQISMKFRFRFCTENCEENLILTH